MNGNEEDVCYYSILEISRDASEVDIKKGYRKQALLWHPDKNPDKKEVAEKKFKQIAEAYEVLADKSKRALYDRYGREGLHESRSKSARYDFDYEHGDTRHFHGFHFRSAEDVFRDFFGGRDPFGSNDLFSDPFGMFGSPFGQVRSRAGNPTNGNHRVSTMHSGFGLFNDFDHSFGAASHGSGQHIRSVGDTRNHRLSEDNRPFSNISLSSLFHIDPFFSHGTSFSSAFSGGSGNSSRGGNFRSTKTTTTIKDGKKITRRIVTENGKETVTEEVEDYGSSGGTQLTGGSSSMQVRSKK